MPPSFVLYMAWLQIAVELQHHEHARDAFRRIVMAATRVKLGVAKLIGLAAIVVRRQFLALDFSFRTLLLKLPQKPIPFGSSVEI